ncbi:hypothetical protein FA13DRAFT_1718559 [Coprinellus micaceus]|uniref:Uncharacterized protein n=1 Tax=Coprinellus micaceus TaxID=71717 RepID=A0A4Y7SDC2_COPMI|nr:hypothetical protein FA13DRAFT_1718559 [Coprinellus micaceus]
MEQVQGSERAASPIDGAHHRNVLSDFRHDTYTTGSPARALHDTYPESLDPQYAREPEVYLDGKYLRWRDQSPRFPFRCTYPKPLDVECPRMSESGLKQRPLQPNLTSNTQYHGRGYIAARAGAGICTEATPAFHSTPRDAPGSDVAAKWDADTTLARLRRETGCDEQAISDSTRRPASCTQVEWNWEKGSKRHLPGDKTRSTYYQFVRNLHKRKERVGQEAREDTRNARDDDAIHWRRGRDIKLVP